LERHLSSAEIGSHRATERISSGQRINHAADDSAGLGTSENQEAISRSKRAAMRNIEQAVHQLNMADGGLSSISEMLKRLRELAVQAISETLPDNERAYLHTEFSGLTGEITRTARGTLFNGQNLLSYRPIDVGIILDSSGSMGGEIAEVRSALNSFTSTLENSKLDVVFGLAEANNSRDAVDGTKQLADLGGSEFNTELTNLTVEGGLVDPYSALLNTSGINDILGTAEPDAFSWNGAGARKNLIYVTDTGREIDLVPGSETQSSVAASLSNEEIVVNTINPISQNSVFSGITSSTGGSTYDIGDGSGSGVSTALDSIANDLATEFGQTGRSVQVSHGNGAEHRIELDLPVHATAAGLDLDDEAISSIQDAMSALEAVDSALNQVNQMRSKMGAYTNRLNAAFQYEITAVENLISSERQIRDADYALETAALAKHEIIRQSALSLFAQLRTMERDAVMTLVE
jgi:flagellin